MFRTQELVLRQHAGFQEAPDQPRHPSIGNASAYTIHQVMVVDVIEAASDISLNDPGIRQPEPPATPPRRFVAGSDASHS